ncbi:uncharacterized protein TNCV_3127132 [Trichonephila clavipes]|nr:uncharacterized protein TNCV_3127132 [Trichonephila clavipes]
MESLPVVIHGFQQNDAAEIELFSEKRSENCNICRNFKNIHDRSHRFSKVHQKKLTERFRIIRSKMKMIKLDFIVVHDAEWGRKDELYCYFCDKPVKKHAFCKGLAVEYLGYMIHLADTCHMEAVKSYLKYHARNEKFELFCKTKPELEKFVAKIPAAGKRYLTKLNYLNRKDINQIREVELQRQKLVKETLEISKNADYNAMEGPSYEQLPQRISKLQHNSKHKKNKNLDRKTKVPPWLMNSEGKGDVQQTVDKPVIGPTFNDLRKQVAHLKKRGLPTKRLKLNSNCP